MPQAKIKTKMNTRTKTQPPWTCEVCNKCFKKEHNLKKHLLTQGHEETIFQCNKCDLPGFKKQTDFVAHVKTSHTHCTVCTCGQIFDSYVKYKLHKDKCENADSSVKKAPHNYYCSICNQTFARKYTLIKHNKRKHGELSRTEENQHGGCTIGNSRSEGDTTQPETYSSTNAPRMVTRNTTTPTVDNDKVTFSNNAVIKVIQAACKTLEASGNDVLVVVANKQRYQWFGAGCGKTFGKHKPEFLNAFSKYCKDMRDSGSNIKMEVEDSVVNIDEDQDTGTQGLDSATLDVDTQTERTKSISGKSSKKRRLLNSGNTSEENTAEVKGYVSADPEGRAILRRKHRKPTIASLQVSNSYVCVDGGTTVKVSTREDSVTETIDDEYMDADSSDTDDYDVADTDEVVDNEEGEEGSSTVMEHDVKKLKLLEGIIEDLQKAEAEEISETVVKDIVKRRYAKSKVAVYGVPDFNKGKHECLKCGYKFLWKCHLQTHQIKRPQCSPDDDYNVTNKDILKEEITFLHEGTQVEITAPIQSLVDAQKNGPYTCVVCNMKLRQHSSHFRHLITHNKNTIFKCNICTQAFTSEAHISSHLKDHFIFPFECCSCTWRFTTRSQLEKHRLNGCGNISLLKAPFTKDKSMDRSYMCSVCKENIHGLQNFQEHLKTADHGHTVAGFGCKHCEKVFDTFHTYEEHVRQHEGTHPCPFCAKMFMSKTVLTDHVRNHRNRMQDFICYYCGQSFNQKRRFDIHLRIHTGEYPFKCQVEGCTKVFRSFDGLAQHRWCHNESQFICDKCGNKFSSPIRLNHHRRKHTKDYLWPCLYCSEKYASLFRYKRHLAKSHPEMIDDIYEKTRIRLYPCEICKKMYHDPADLRRHLNNHDGIKPFKCRYCDKTFSDKSNMKYHEENHEGVPKIKCSMCPRKFKLLASLASHVERKHGLNQMPVSQDIQEPEEIITEPVLVTDVDPASLVNMDNNAVMFTSFSNAHYMIPPGNNTVHT